MAGIATTCYYLTLSSTRDDEDDSVAKMKAAEEALEAKQKLTKNPGHRHTKERRRLSRTKTRNSRSVEIKGLGSASRSIPILDTIW
ncbi:hypothetical protein V6Z11_D13G071600 [Gossypium hirsutum]